MSIRNCKNCGKLFKDGFTEYCDDCKVILEDEFTKIRKHLEDNPGASIQIISNALSIPINRIKMYLRDERLEIVGNSSDSSSFLTCKKCKSAIKTGNYCENCSRGIMSDIQSSTKEIKTKMTQEGAKKENTAFKFIKKRK